MISCWASNILIILYIPTTGPLRLAPWVTGNLARAPGVFGIFLGGSRRTVEKIDSRCSKISKNCCLPFKAYTNSADLDQSTVPGKAVRSSSSLFAFLTSIL